MAETDSVAAREGDEVSGVEADLVEDAEECSHVGGRGREAGEGDVLGGEVEPVSPA